jgi:hypothetical protein
MDVSMSFPPFQPDCLGRSAQIASQSEVLYWKYKNIIGAYISGADSWDCCFALCVRRQFFHGQKIDIILLDRFLKYLPDLIKNY